MAVKFGVFVPQGWRMDLVQIKDPIEKYEAMTRVAQAADRGPWDAIWVYDHFHTVPEPTPETTFEPLVADADSVAAHLRTLIDAGIDSFIMYIPGIADDREPLHRFETEVIPQLA